MVDPPSSSLSLLGQYSDPDAEASLAGLRLHFLPLLPAPLLLFVFASSFFLLETVGFCLALDDLVD